jgi:hypothetical protein
MDKKMKKKAGGLRQKLRKDLEDMPLEEEAIPLSMASAKPTKASKKGAIRTYVPYVSANVRFSDEFCIVSVVTEMKLRA